jgi:hypothetical protein
MPACRSWPKVQGLGPAQVQQGRKTFLTSSLVPVSSRDHRSRRGLQGWQ